MTKKDLEFLLLQSNNRIIELESMVKLNKAQVKPLTLFHDFFIKWLNN